MITNTEQLYFTDGPLEGTIQLDLGLLGLNQEYLDRNVKSNSVP
jgi:hypothetical protein